MNRPPPQLSRVSNIAAVIYPLPGLALWLTWFFAPIPEGPGGGMILVPFLGCLLVAALFLTAMAMVSPASRWMRCFAVSTNLSFPLFFLFSVVL